MKLDYQPVVNVESIYPNKSKNDLLSGAKETAKYQVKSADYITDDEQRDLQVTDDLEQALSHTRAISYGKLFKIIRKKLQLENEDDLINTNDLDEADVLTDAEIVVAKWNYELQNYFIN